MSATPQAQRRLQKEYQAIQKSPPPFIVTRPNESNILEWHYIMRGPPDTPYHGGEYYGVVVFPPDYPFAPPMLKMHTPSGRFSPGAQICTSMSNFHPGSWNPGWSVQSILTGLLSFMVTDELTTGSVRATTAERVALAKVSHEWNRKQPKFRALFPEYSQPQMVDLPDMGPPPKKPSTTTTTIISTNNPFLASSEMTASLKPSAIPLPPPPIPAPTADDGSATDAVVPTCGKSPSSRTTTAATAGKNPDHGRKGRNWGTVAAWCVATLAVSWALSRALDA